MERGVTPFIGLAVVVALALAAVFGSMSLANPAMAAIGQPGDAELTERTIAPQDATLELVIGQTKWFDISEHLNNYPDNVLQNGSHTVNVTPSDGSILVADDTNTANVNEGPELSEGRAVFEVKLTGAAEGRARVTVVVLGAADGDRSSADTTKNRTVVLSVNVVEQSDSTPAVKRGSVRDLSVRAGSTAGVKIDGSKYFRDGTGPGGEIEEYMLEVIPSTDTDVTVREDVTGSTAGSSATSSTGKFVIIPGAGVAQGADAFLKLTAVDGVEGEDGANPFHNFFVVVGEASTATGDLPSLVPGGDGAGSTTDYTVSFLVDEAGGVNTRQEDLIIEFHEDYTVPAAIRNASVAVTTNVTGRTPPEITFTPEDVTVDGNEIFISLGDMDESDAGTDYHVGRDAANANDAEETVTVLFRQSAGISNPTGAGDYEGIVAINFGSVEFDNGEGEYVNLAETIPHSISIDPEDGGLGEEVTVKGKGFKNGTSLTVFRDADNDGVLGSGDDVLCTDPLIEGNVGTCTFTVTHPTFTAGATNHIDAVDGVNDTADEKSKTFELKSSIAPSPDGGSPGEMILIQMVDFSPRQTIERVTIGGQDYCGANADPAGVTRSCPGSVDSQGSGSFSIAIPNWARGGLQELKVWDTGGKSASAKITLLGPQIQVNPGTVVANQRISLIGTGFSPRSIIANVDDLPARHIAPMIQIGGETIDEGRINDGDPVRVDNGGNWSASVDLPLSEATTASGDRTIRVRDSLARTGVVEVSIPDRVVTVTPDTGRVGTIAVVRGTGFPSKNDEGSNFTVEIEYEAANGNSITVSALTDASGRFEAQLRIPTTAAIPSSNQIHVRFRDDDDVTVPITIPHEVPEGIIMPSSTSGGPGSVITLSGEGFKSFVPISQVKIGTLDVTPSPKPATDGNGMMMFDITIPGLDVGIQTIEVNVGRTTSSVGFTVTESGINPGDIKPVAEGLEDLGDNLDVIWHFNNDTKSWTFYDGQDGSDLTHVITGETYLILVKNSVEVILNRDTRSLTCVGGNCWNQIVW